MIPHNKQLYESFIKQLLHDNTELYKIYIALNIYKYQFITNNITYYIDDYINIMIRELTGHTIALDKYIENLYDNVFDNKLLLNLLETPENMLKKLLERYFVSTNIKIEKHYELITNNFCNELLQKYNVHERYNRIKHIVEICLLFNKITVNNYVTITNNLNKYSYEELLETFTTRYMKSVFIYTHLILRYIISINENVNDDIKQVVYDNPLIDPELLCCFMVVFDDVEYFELSSKRTTTIIYSLHYIELLSSNMKEFIVNKAKEYLETATGYIKYNLLDVVTQME